MHCCEIECKLLSSYSADDDRQSPSCSNALNTLRQIRRGVAVREQRAYFASYSTPETQTSHKTRKQKGQSWTVRLVCLNSTSVNTAPCTPAVKEKLIAAGIGEKKVIVPEVSCTKETFNELILESFPKLKNAGGYELLRCIPNTKHLEVISSKIAQTPKLLKTVVGNGRVYIRPVQRELSLVPDDDICSSPEVRN